MRPLLQNREKAEARRLQDQKLRKARERAADEEAKRHLGELVNSMLEEEEEHAQALSERELELCRKHFNYRPDERELFRDRADDLDWERANREYEER